MGGMAGSGQGNPLGNSLIRAGVGFGGRAPEQSAPTMPAAGYTPVQANVYSPAFSSNQNSSQSGISPLLSQLKAQQSDPFAQFGLRAMLTSAVQSEMPQAGLPSLMPAQTMPMANPVQFNSPALAYRPNMDALQQNLRRVAPKLAPQMQDAGGDGGLGGGPALQSYYDSTGGG